LELGLEVATRVGNLIGQEDIHINFGQNYRLQGEADLVIKDLEKGIQICESVGNRPSAAKAMIILADAQKGRGDHTQAESLYRQALIMAQQDDL
jgi:Tfp pilus assembly protein PilF